MEKIASRVSVDTNEALLPQPKKIANQNNANRPEISFLNAYVSGSVSSAFTTVLFQPLELLKTRIQILSIQNVPGEVTSRQGLDTSSRSAAATSRPIMGRSTRSVIQLIQQHNILYLWRGTCASLLRSVPGVGLYYSSLNLMNELYAKHESSNYYTNSLRSFSSGFIARSFVSSILLPITVIKVRYESGTFIYKSILSTIKDSYLKSGWVGFYPTIIRDSLFSGVYYMLYSESKHKISLYYEMYPARNRKNLASVYFVSGLVSGSIASLITNPADVLKTNIQIYPDRHKTMIGTAKSIYNERNGLIGFFDGLGPRMLRRTLVAAFTWTVYEHMTVVIK